MTNVQHIKSFMFGFAKYRLRDNRGSELFLEIDYANNTHKIRLLSHKVDKTFLREVHRVAQTLLVRKHNVNFVDRLVID